MPKGIPNDKTNLTRVRVAGILERGRWCAYEWTTAQIAGRLRLADNTVAITLQCMLRSGDVIARRDYDQGVIYWMHKSTKP